MTTLREAAQQALEALEVKRATACGWRTDCDKAITALKAALAEEALQNLTDVQQEMERNFCPRCGKRTNDIHTCTPPHEEHFCDTHCTWLDHAPGCVRAEPQTTHWEGCSAVHPECAKAEAERIRAAMQRLTDVSQELEADLSSCPKCGGPADNGHDRSIPPIPYFCTKCMEVEERAHGIGESNG